MSWPNWMKDNVWQWLTGISVSVIGVIVGVVLALWPSSPVQVTSINGNKNIQVADSPGATVMQNITKEVDPEERAKQDTILQNTEENRRVLKRIQESLAAKKIEADPQLVSELKDKIQSLEKELEERTRTTKDKRAEEALVASKGGDYEKAREFYETLREEEKEKEREHSKTAYNLGNVYFVELDFLKALEAYLDAVRLAPDNSAYLNEAGYTFSTLAQYDKATEYFEKALMSGLKTFGEDHRQVAL